MWNYRLVAEEAQHLNMGVPERKNREYRKWEVIKETIQENFLE